MKIWQKIGLGFCAVVLISLFNLALLLYQQDRAAFYEEKAYEAQDAVNTLDRVLADHIRWKVNVLVGVLNRAEPDVAIDPTACGLGRFLSKVRPETLEERQILADLGRVHRTMHEGSQKMKRLFEGEADEDVIVEQMISVYNNIINPTSKEVFKGLNQLEKIYKNRSADLRNKAREQLALVEKVSVFSNITVAIVAIVFGLWVARSVTLPIRTISETLTSVATGDFSRDLEVKGRDELSAVANGVNGMLASLRPLIKNVATRADVIEKEIKTMEAYSEKAVKGGRVAFERADKMYEQSEKVVESVNEEASSIQEISGAIEEISQNTTRASVVTQDAVERAEGAGEIISRLSMVSQDIQSIIKLICDIAEQTNLLALNATIEAARAGEAGKGFAVVANEVKELAKQTANATEEITEKIQAIRTESQAAVEVTKDIMERVGEINDITSTIAAAVEEQTTVIRDIASKVEDQRAGALALSADAKEAQKAAGTAEEAARTNLANIRQLAKVAQEFKSDVSKFKL